MIWNIWTCNICITYHSTSHQFKVHEPYHLWVLVSWVSTFLKDIVKLPNNDVIHFRLEVMQALISGKPCTLINHENLLLDHTLIVSILQHIKEDFHFLFRVYEKHFRAKINKCRKKYSTYST